MSHTPSFPSAEYLDSVAGAIRVAVHALDRHESDLALLPGRNIEPHGLWSSALGRLECSLRDWQQILSSVADHVRSAEEELESLDADLNRALNMFATARKHLQGTLTGAMGDSRA
jgi:hypothetical protein